MDAQNFDALVDFRFAFAFGHWRRIDIKPFDFNETVRLEAVGKLYRSIASGSVGKRNRFVSIARLRITAESNFAVWRLAKVQIFNQFEHFAFVAFEDEDIVEVCHKPTTGGFSYCQINSDKSLRCGNYKATFRADCLHIEAIARDVFAIGCHKRKLVHYNTNKPAWMFPRLNVSVDIALQKLANCLCRLSICNTVKARHNNLSRAYKFADLQASFVLSLENVSVCNRVAET